VRRRYGGRDDFFGIDSLSRGRTFNSLGREKSCRYQSTPVFALFNVNPNPSLHVRFKFIRENLMYKESICLKAWRIQTKLFALVFVFLAGVHSSFAQSDSAVLLPGLGQHHHTISTKNPEAQRFFDQGLTLVFGFNHEEAARAFRRASELDPQSAMAFWGIALALGPCINLMDVDPPHEKAAHEAVQNALLLAPSATQKERDYIQALAKRYSADPKVDLGKLDAEYANAMRELSKRNPDDLDAATLYAESLMDLHPWKLWSLDGRPTEGTEEIVAVLESVLRRDPNHLGANHYYIHATEASRHPEWALASARRLEALAPAAGHLVHMPAHTYMRVGDYSAAAHSNEAAANADRVYLRDSGTTDSMYDMMYYCHNLHFLAAAYSMAGDFGHAKQAADELVAHVGPMLHDMPIAEVYAPYSIFVLVRFHRWDEVLKLPPPNPSLAMTTAFWHFARGSAFAAKGQIAKAEAERTILETARKERPADQEFSFFFNKAQTFLELAENVLDARIAAAKGDHEQAIKYWEKAVEIEDKLYYGEPPEWFYPVRESLGAALLLNGQADRAEAVFRADLEQYPRNPRSLFGLLKSLEAKKSANVGEVRREFEAAWKNADVALELGDL
jgi:tetratricopeptide (TPR) repeat protein